MVSLARTLTEDFFAAPYADHRVPRPRSHPACEQCLRLRRGLPGPSHHDRASVAGQRLDQLGMGLRHAVGSCERG